MRSIFCEGPSRPASCDTARPARRAGQPQKRKKAPNQLKVWSFEGQRPIF
ncbi:hypothetical protein SGRA_3435 [Saprospira grandis str. Lewin]|uniref:Uncharacterized protein n=1 Tax=Saprospira grandis (strain Lewin) TaxID=984262 RepID=H6L1T2_SAPGL|nr:hypothetical protein SGRA_3435 [Saprospira grandis str. Lewin]